ncbi:MAG: riboflavin synthase [Piscirickettsiaceae bacterium]|nr:riboflavin synthase [Piscirickettsiaceae bacterium]
MFTGIITAIGKIVAVQLKCEDLKLQVSTQQSKFMDITSGDSISINGVCLTVCKVNSEIFIFDISCESLKLTNLGNLTNTSEVNLEKALSIQDRLGGHLVNGHVDGLGIVVFIEKSARSITLQFAILGDIGRYIAKKGSICVDGVSLTVNNVHKKWFEVNVIPYTMHKTIINNYRIGTKVNLEIDLIARYLEQLLL